MDEALPIRKLFPEFGVRMVAVAVDFVLVLFIVQWLRESLIAPLGFEALNQRLLVSAVLFTYFVVSWLSPLRATPAQWLFGMRVVDERGDTLAPVPACLRALLLVALVTATFAIFEVPVRLWMVLIALVAYSLLYIAALTPNRQAIHDTLAKSLVVARVSLTAQHIDRLREHVANASAGAWTQRRPSVFSMAGNLLVLLVPVIVLANVAAINNSKDLYARTSYAVAETRAMQTAITEYYDEHGAWPGRYAEIGVPTRSDYPDGGYYQIQDNGEILIRFTIRPELRDGALRITPRSGDDGIRWHCRAEGEIERGAIPAMCRD